MAPAIAIRDGFRWGLQSIFIELFSGFVFVFAVMKLGLRMIVKFEFDLYKVTCCVLRMNKHFLIPNCSFKY